MLKKTKDWNTFGDPTHRAKVEAAKVPPMSKEYEQQHRDWFRMVRGFAKVANANENANTIPIVELRYDTFTNQSIPDAQKHIQDQIDAQFKDS